MIKEVSKGVLDEIADIIAELFSKEESIIFLLMFVSLGAFLLIFPLGILASVIEFIRLTWWFWVFTILFREFETLWLFWRRQMFQTEGTPCILMEIQMPREVLRTPRAMEQVLMSIHGLRNTAADPEEKYWDGEVTRPYALEMASFGGEIHFYIRFYKKEKELVEAAFFAQYPDLELVQVRDYAEELPASVQDIYDAGKDIWGVDLVLEKEAAYPIKSYREFIDEPVEEMRVDPISSFLEVMSKIKKNDFMGVQLIIIPAGNEWKEKNEPVLKKIKEETGKRTVLTDEGDAVSSFSTRTPGETDLIRNMEEGLTKFAFDTVVRTIYISEKEGFYDSYPRRGLRGAFNQYSSLGQNSFVMNNATNTLAKIWFSPYLFPKARSAHLKERHLYNYKSRETPTDIDGGRFVVSNFLNWNLTLKSFFMNTEGIAPLFHPPTSLVLTAPHMPRTEGKRAGPPSGLPIFGEDES